MVNIDVFEDDHGRIIGFEAKGHAMGRNRQSEYDLICCAISILTLNIVNGITDYLKIQPQELGVDDGWLKIVLAKDLFNTADGGTVAQVDALFGSMLISLRELAKDHPKYLQLKKRRWTW